VPMSTGRLGSRKRQESAYHSCQPGWPQSAPHSRTEHCASRTALVSNESATLRRATHCAQHCFANINKLTAETLRPLTQSRRARSSDQCHRRHCLHSVSHPAGTNRQWRPAGLHSTLVARSKGCRSQPSRMAHPDSLLRRRPDIRRCSCGRGTQPSKGSVSENF
jgi:hypothetical protein